MSIVTQPVLTIPEDLEVFFRIDFPEILDRINGSEEAKWGIMTVHHMLEHLQLPLKFVTGEIVPPLFTPEERLGRLKDFLLSDYALTQNFKFPMLPVEEVAPLETADIAEAKEQLLHKLDEFLAVVLSRDFQLLQHPIFGMLNSREWLLFQYKHFYHHLSQFGLITAN